MYTYINNGYATNYTYPRKFTIGQYWIGLRGRNKPTTVFTLFNVYNKEGWTANTSRHFERRWSTKGLLWRRSGKRWPHSCPARSISSRVYWGRWSGSEYSVKYNNSNTRVSITDYHYIYNWSNTSSNTVDLFYYSLSLILPPTERLPC